MKVSTPAFENENMIPTKYTCEGDDLNPEIRIEEVPEEAVSLAIIVHDHDAPGGDFAHWLLWNITPAMPEIREGTEPIGSIEGVNDFGNLGWNGPCPPSGMHRYEFHLYALRDTLELPQGSTKEELRAAMQHLIIEEASFAGRYEKMPPAGK